MTVDAELLQDSGLKLDDDGLLCCEACGSTEFAQICNATIRSYWHANKTGGVEYQYDKHLGEETDHWECLRCEAPISMPDEVIG